MMRTHTILLAGLCALSLGCTLGIATTAAAQVLSTAEQLPAQRTPTGEPAPEASDRTSEATGTQRDAATLTPRELELRGVPEVRPEPTGEPGDLVTPRDGRATIAAGTSLMLLGGAMQLVGLVLALDVDSYTDSELSRGTWAGTMTVAALIPYTAGGVMLATGHRNRRTALLDHAALLPAAAPWDPAAAAADFERTVRLARRRRVMTTAAAVAFPTGTLLMLSGFGMSEYACTVPGSCLSRRSSRGTALMAIGVATTVVGGVMVIRAGSLRRRIVETEQRYQPYRFTVSPATAAGAWGGQLTVRY